MKRGFTLVEQMIAVAILGIAAASSEGLSVHSERAALGELQRARAGVLLEYQADRAMKGLKPNPEVVLRLAAALPEANVEREIKGDVQTFKVTWRAPSGGPGSRSLTVLGAKR
jgi:prepilin-type N-terminal cleavage/methylation domain-containing protein